MNVDLFLKKVPQVVKDLISHEAVNNRRSINQEAIALLEEALLSRVELAGHRKPTPHEVLEGYAAARRTNPVAEQGPPSLASLPSDHAH